MKELIFSFNVVMPVFLIVFLGIFLKRIRLIDERFVQTSSALVFNVTIPALIFINIAKADFTQAFQGALIGFGVVSELAAFGLIWIFSYSIRDAASRGSFIQAGFRSNFAILGLAILMNLYGPKSIPPASVLLTFIMPLFNILSIIALLKFRDRQNGGKTPNLLMEVLKNPLVLAAIAALPFSIWSVHIPQVFDKSIAYLASLTMPLALIGIGAAMSFSGLKTNLGLISMASLIKIVLLPLLFTTLAAVLGLRGQNLGILFILFASPTAIVSFIMARAMNSNSLLAANVILVTTLLSILTLGGGIFILKFLGMI